MRLSVGALHGAFDAATEAPGPRRPARSTMTTLRDGICRAKGCRRPGRLAPVFRRADPGVDAQAVDEALREAMAPPPSLAEARVAELPGRPVPAEQLWFLLALPPVRAGGTRLGPPRHDAAPYPGSEVFA
ncbi:hypothetical protein ABZY81_01095 [Streptomyces sp. NPDC006514]|uniref:hypothetical protein n=1 Tax=Streptomyces sp. NPDC006514 TaxID=3154308 RepID=UPI0033AF0F7D